MSRELSSATYAALTDSAADTCPDALLERSLVRSARRQDLARSFPGEWVAVSSDWSCVYAHGASYLAVCEGARQAGAPDPLVTRLVV